LILSALVRFIRGSKINWCNAMNNWQKIEKAVAAAAEMPEAEFGRWLDNFCRQDAELKFEIESLLVFQKGSENFLEKPVGEYAAQILPDAEDDDFSGKVFGNYKILREIGRGGMGAVFLAERIDGQFSQQAALKIVRQTFVEKELLQHFKRERQILANLNHPNIAKLLDGGVSAHGEPFLVMEYIEGETLLKFAGNRALDTKSRLKIFLKICRAVAFAHRNLIVHRDIKPTNILVTESGEPKLLDFGLAKVLDDALSDENQTQTAFRALTPAYASPEQMRGETVTTASDIYSLGKILAELTEKSNSELRNITAMALRDEPERRYKSVEAFAEDIERYLDGLPVSARPATFRYRAEKFIQRNKITVAAGTLVFLAIVSGLIIALWQAGVARRQRDAAQQERLKAERISEFLAAALEYSDPSAAAPGAKNRRAATISEMLDDFAPRIETELADQPEVRASLQQTVGQAYYAQARFAEAERYLNAALETKLKLYGENSQETALTYAALAVVSEAKGDFAATANFLEKTLAIYRRQPPTEQIHIKIFAGTLSTLGDVYWTKGDFAAAEGAYNESLSLAAQVENQKNELVANAKRGLGITRYAQGRLDEAAALLREAVSEYRTLPHLRWKLPDALNFLAQTLTWKNASGNSQELDEALKYLKESEATSVEVWGENNFWYPRSLWLEVYALCFKGECAAAEKSLDKAEELNNRYFPDNKITRANILDARNLIFTRTGRVAEGETCGRQSVALYQSDLPRGAPSITLAQIHLAQNLTAQKKYEEAERILTETYQNAREVQGAEHWRTKEVEGQLTELHKVWRKPV
jgi:eukaryotic-like serine/threonine-protein kinase